ncbi:MAG: alanine racemase [Ruthenibacterium sp.]
MEFERRCWAEVDLDALRDNFLLVQKKASGTPVMAVVKADAYGHGDAAAAKTFEKAGAAGFAVSGFEEARHLRGAGIEKPILILGYTGTENAAALVQQNIIQTVYALDYAKALSAAAVAAGVRVQVHIKLDTGMGRIGFAVRDDFSQAVAQIVEACALPGLCACGIFTHFAVADSTLPDDKTYTVQQFQYLTDTIARLKEQGIVLQTAHCCNSAGTFDLPQYHLDMVRAGIILYGENPSDTVTLPGLHPALRLKAAVSLVKEIPAQDCISYGRTYRSEKPMRVATVSVGYADGYPRALSNCGTVSLHGKPAKVLGRVCMDQMMVDVSAIPETKAGDIAVVFGGGAADSVDDIARMTNTISYEILCNLSRRVQRVYLENGREISCINYLQEV